MLIVAGQQLRAGTVPGLHMCEGGRNELTAEVTGKNSSTWVHLLHGIEHVGVCTQRITLLLFINERFMTVLPTVCVRQVCVSL